MSVMVMLAGLLPPLAAWSKGKPNESPAEGEPSRDACLSDLECKKLVDAGRAESEAAQFETALRSYQSAHIRRPTPWLLVNIGRMQQKLGHHEQALSAYEMFLQTDLGRTDQVLRGRVQGYLAEAENTVTEQKKQTAAEQVQLAAEQQRLINLKVQLNSERNLLVLESGRLASTRKPVYKRWWFWVLIGGATAAAATSVAVGASLASASREPDYVAGLPQLRPFQ